MKSSSDRAAAKSLAPLRRLLPFLAPYRARLCAALISLVVAAAAMLALPVALRQVIDRALKAKDPATINIYFAGFLGAAVVFGVFAALRFYLVSSLGERVIADIRTRVYARVIRMDPTFFEVTRTGEVLSRLTTDTTLVQAIAGVNLSITLRSILNGAGALTMLALTSPQLTGVIVLMIPVIVLPLITMARRLRGLSRDSQDRVADTSALADETLNAMQTVQAFTLEDLQTRRYADAVESGYETARRRIRVRAALTAIGMILVFGGITFVLWLGARALHGGSMTGGELTQFLVYAVLAGASAANLIEMWGEIQRAAGAMDRLAELLSAEPALVAPAHPTALPPRVAGRLRFHDVTFHYPSRPETPALDRFTLDVAEGETVALVGPSGAGKSTTFQLLLRFYDTNSGAVLIDGTDLREVDPRALRAQIGLVPQDTVLFGTTAMENIRYGRPGAPDAEVIAAARAAAADEFLRALPEGYDTFLGERGTRLSGGQRQRVAIARALLKDPPILLLDEATSALDAESESLVQVALERLMQNRTTVIIAHRLATVQKADRIVVMDGGRVVDSGTHAELLVSSPLYARLAALQFTAAGQ